LFDLNIGMEVKTDKDFVELRKEFNVWRKRFPMFKHDVKRIESIIETHIQNHSIALVNYRQTHNKTFLERAQKEIDEINRVVELAEKTQLMALLSQR
jgi:hypothetical protein